MPQAPLVEQLAAKERLEAVAVFEQQARALAAGVEALQQVV